MVSIVRTPAVYTPANNPVIFSVSGSSIDTVLFKIQVIENMTDTIVYVGNIYPTPLSPSVASVNLSKQLGALVQSDVDNETNISLGKDRPIKGYKVNVTDYGISTGGTLTSLSTGVTSSVFHIYESEMDVVNYTKNLDEFLIKSGQTSSFLTIQPNYKEVNEHSSEQLYFIQSGFTYLGLNLRTSDNSSYTYPFTGTTPYIIQPYVPGTKAIATVTLDDAYNEQGDNVGIKINGDVIGFVTANTNEQSNVSLASLLYTNMLSNYNFNFSAYTATLSSNVITISAPLIGTSANGRVVSTYQPVTGVTSSGNTGTLATVTFDGYPLPYNGDNVVIGLIDPVIAGYIELADFTATSGDAADWDTFTNHIVSEIGFNFYDYTVTKLDEYSFRITSPVADIAVASLWNGRTVSMGYSSSMFFDFGGGVNAIASGTTTYDILSATTTNFIGGTNPIEEIVGAELGLMGRFQVSPKMFIENGVPSNKFVNNQNYSVVVKDLNGNNVSDTRYYQYKESNCFQDYVNVFFTNSFGGVDNYQFISPQINHNSNRLNIRRNQMNLDRDAPYFENGMYSRSEETYSNKGKETVKVYTKILSDDDSLWLTELMNSKNWYIELSTGELVPVQLKTTDYSIQKVRYSGSPVQFQFEFELPDNFFHVRDNSIIIND